MRMPKKATLFVLASLGLFLSGATSQAQAVRLERKGPHLDLRAEQDRRKADARIQKLQAEIRKLTEQLERLREFRPRARGAKPRAGQREARARLKRADMARKRAGGQRRGRPEALRRKAVAGARKKYEAQGKVRIQATKRKTSKVKGRSEVVKPRFKTFTAKVESRIFPMGGKGMELRLLEPKKGVQGKTRTYRVEGAPPRGNLKAAPPRVYQGKKAHDAPRKPRKKAGPQGPGIRSWTMMRGRQRGSFARILPQIRFRIQNMMRARMGRAMHARRGRAMPARMGRAMPARMEQRSFRSRGPMGLRRGFGRRPGIRSSGSPSRVFRGKAGPKVRNSPLRTQRNRRFRGPGKPGLHGSGARRHSAPGKAAPRRHRGSPCPGKGKHRSC